MSGPCFRIVRRFTLLFLITSLLYVIPAEKLPPSDRLRIVSPAPSTTEILFAPGSEKHIAGVSPYCNFPEAARCKGRIGTFSQPNYEKIVKFKPHIVFAQES